MAGLERFKSAQAAPGAGYDDALREMRGGRKTGHWIWYVLPQLAGLGMSEMSRSYALHDAAETADYLRDPELGPRLLTIVAAIDEQLAAHPALQLSSLMGSDIDARKLVSSLTLFEAVARRLDETESFERARALGEPARRILAAAAAEGYEPCAFTLSRLANADR